MTIEELAHEIAAGLIATGIEGGFDSVSMSTAGDYPSIGVSQWEGARANSLLEKIPDGEYYAWRTYSSIVGSGELDDLIDLLGSKESQEAQLEMLSTDCEKYVWELQNIESLDDSRCMIYAGMWCPTSHYVVRRFLQNRESRINLRSLAQLRDIFREEYAIAADIPYNCFAGYARRAEITFDYVASLDLTTKYGVLWYGQYPHGR